MKPHFLAIVVLPCISVAGFSQDRDSAVLLNGMNSAITIPNSAFISPVNELTISVWVNSANYKPRNKDEVILSKRKHSELANFANTDNWEIYDATNQNGSSDIRGFVGGAFDGRFVYCSPWWDGQTQSGKILRYDTRKSYLTPESWHVYDAENEDGYSDLRGLEGNVFDGQYVYFVPLHHDGKYFTTVLRYDTHGEFSNPDSWDVFDALQLDPDGTMKGFVGAVFDGNYIYFMPNPFDPHSKTLRLNTQTSFHDEESWSIFDLSTLADYNPANGFFGGIFDGKYLYLVPYNANGTVVRLDTTTDFNSPESWSSIDLNLLLQGRVHGTYTGAAFDGRYIYFSPAHGGKVVRFDTTKDFYSSAGWEVSNIQNLDGVNDVQGGVGPTYDGRYIYFPPMYSEVGRSGKFVVYDSQKEFLDMSSWNFFDLSTMDSNLAGFEGAVFDGQHVYFFPMNFEDSHGKIPRYHTTKLESSGYELKFSNNSSSFGSTPGKLCFHIATESGSRSVYLKGDQAYLTDGNWHHIGVTYNGSILNLFIDGILNNSVVFNDQASILSNSADLIIGNSAGSLTNGYKGYLNDLGLWDTALNENEIRQIISNGPNQPDTRLKAFWSFDSGLVAGQIEDLSVNANHSAVTDDVTLVPVISAGRDVSACITEGPFTLEGFYPEGGVWVGDIVDTSGLVTPDSTGTFALTYQITLSFGNVQKIFSDKINLSVLKSGLEDPVIDLPSPFSLRASPSASHYEWMINDTLSTDSSRVLKITGDHTYKVRIRDTGGCYTNFSKPFTTTTPPSPEIRQIGFSTLATSSAGQSFIWFKNDTLLIEAHANRLRISEPGTYKVRAVDTFGNYSPLSLPFKATYPEIPEIGRLDFYTIKTETLGIGFEWYRNDTLLEANMPSIKALVPGYYKVRVLDSLNTFSSFSEAFYNEDTWIYLGNDGEEEYTLDISAGEDVTICPSIDSFVMTDFYPEGGTWSGERITPDGVFHPSRDLAGSVITITYSIQKTFETVSKTFVASKRVFLEQFPVITSSGNIICNGNGITLTANGDFERFLWSTGDTLQSIVVNSPGTYHVSGISDVTCELISLPISLEYDDIPAPKINLTEGFRLESVLDYQDAASLSFIWMRNDSILNRTGASGLFTKTGYYRSRAVSPSGCISEYSDKFYYDVSADIQKNIVLFPNPAKDFFYIGILVPFQTITVNIISPRGLQIYNTTLELNGATSVLKIDLTEFDQTFYFVNIQTEFGAFTRKLIVNKGG